MKIFNLITCIMPFFVVSTASSQNGGLQFSRERVDAFIYSKDTLEIRGIYWFTNSSKDKINTGIFYPFPLDSNCLYPHFIEVFHLPGNLPVDFNKSPDGIIWKIELAAKSVDSFKVVYKQIISGMQGRYIVTSAKAWGTPLQTATFSVSMPEDIVLDYWAFKSDSIVVKENAITYYATFTPFWPETDMYMRWRVK